MRKIIYALSALCLLGSCQSDPSSELLLVSGEVKGLKKGMLYLQQVRDSSLVVLDSAKVEGSGTFELEAEITDPDMFYLYLDKADNNQINDRIPFFTGPGIIEIQTRWNAFESEAEITGSEAHEKYLEYQKVQTRFNVQQLELTQAAMQLEAADSVTLDSLQQLSERLDLRAYLYSLNFAMNNKDSYLAPYIAVTEVGNANTKVLDSIYSALTPEVAASKYGLQLKALIDSDSE